MSELNPALAFFDLLEDPFAATADPAYFYATRSHKECLFRLWNHIDERRGIAVALGHYGAGKTTLLRKVLTGMKAEPHRYLTAVIGSPIPSWTSFALLEAIVNQFGLKPERRSFMDYMEALNRHLMARRSYIITLIIDDAQNLNKRGQLELLRLAQNLETPQHKLLNLVLLAQMEWLQILRAAPNFAQRISLTQTLKAFELDEAQDMIRFRLREAGARGEIFTEDAIRVIHTYAGGSPRVMVTLCRNALQMAAVLRERRIGRDTVLHAIEKTMLPDEEARARVARLLTPGVPLPAPRPQAAAAPVESPPASSARETPRGGYQPLHAERANDLLLRAVQRGAGAMTPED